MCVQIVYVRSALVSLTFLVLLLTSMLSFDTLCINEGLLSDRKYMESGPFPPPPPLNALVYIESRRDLMYMSLLNALVYILSRGVLEYEPTLLDLNARVYIESGPASSSPRLNTLVYILCCPGLDRKALIHTPSLSPNNKVM